MKIVHRIDTLPFEKSVHEALVEDKWIPYPRGEEGLDQLWMLFHQGASVRSKGLLIYGKPNSGKSMLVNKFRQDVIDQMQELSLKSKSCPVLLIETPGHGTSPKSLFLEILKSMNAPIRESHSADKLLTQVEILLRENAVRILILDEIHNLANARKRERDSFLNSLRYLSNRLDLQIVTVGTEQGYRMVQADPQLGSRIFPFKLTPWAQGEKEYAKFVLQLILSCGLKICDDNKKARFMKLMHERTEGLTGETKELVVKAATHAIKKGLDHIPAEILDRTEWMRPSERYGGL